MCVSISICPVARNSTGSQRPPRLSDCDSTAHNGSSRPSVSQTRRRRSSSVVFEGAGAGSDASGFNEFDTIESLAQRMRVAALGELDLQAHFVRRVGMAQRVLVADLAGLVQREQALVEGLHAEV